MITQVTIKLGATTPTDKQYESARADIEATYTLKDEDAINLDKAMDAYQYELRRARIMLKDAIHAVKEELKGTPLEEQKTQLTSKEKQKLRELLGD
tara:strand:+ start:3187 stop:3474 length:288 start_codon:yes stop_codon:yes gene_type:complete